MSVFERGVAVMKWTNQLRNRRASMAEECGVGERREASTWRVATVSIGAVAMWATCCNNLRHFRLEYRRCRHGASDTWLLVDLIDGIYRIDATD